MRIITPIRINSHQIFCKYEKYTHLLYACTAARCRTHSRAAARDSLSISSTSATLPGVRAGTRESVSATTSAIPVNGICSFKNASTAISSAAFKVQVEEFFASWAS